MNQDTIMAVGRAVQAVQAVSQSGSSSDTIIVIGQTVSTVAVIGLAFKVGSVVGTVNTKLSGMAEKMTEKHGEIAIELRLMREVMRIDGIALAGLTTSRDDHARRLNDLERA